MARRGVLIRERRLVDVAEGMIGRGVVDRHPASAAYTGISRKSRVAIQAEHLPPFKSAFSISLILTRSRFHPISKRTVSMRIQKVSPLLIARPAPVHGVDLRLWRCFNAKNSVLIDRMAFSSKVAV